MREELLAAVESERTTKSPDLSWVVRRGRRIRVLRRAAVAASALLLAGTVTAGAVALRVEDPAPDVAPGDATPAPQASPRPPRPQRPRPGEVVEAMSEREQAEVFAIRALAATGLTQPFRARSYLFTGGDDTTQTADGWRVGFSAGDCAPRDTGEGMSFGCRGISGEDRAGNGLTDTYVVVGREAKRWHVVAVEGNMPDEERERVAGYSLPAIPEPPHWEFTATGVWPGSDAPYIEMWGVWVGPYPTAAPGSACVVHAFDSRGKSMGVLQRFYEEAPNREFERAGGARGSQAESSSGVAAVTVRCRQYTGRGWKVDSVASTLHRGRVSGVAFDVVWRGDEGFTARARCRVRLLDRKDRTVWQRWVKVDQLWRPSELDDYPYTVRERVDIGRRPVAAERADVVCETI